MLCRAVPRATRPITHRIPVRRNSTSRSLSENIVKCSPELCSRSCAMLTKQSPHNWTKETPIGSGKTMEQLTCLHNVMPSGANSKAIDLIVEASVIKAELERTKISCLEDEIRVCGASLFTVGAMTSAVLTTGLTAGLSLGVAIYCGSATYRMACEAEEQGNHEKKHLLTAKLYQLEKLLKRT